jgi:hypothetical protein
MAEYEKVLFAITMMQNQAIARLAATVLENTGEDITFVVAKLAEATDLAKRAFDQHQAGEASTDLGDLLKGPAN